MRDSAARSDTQLLQRLHRETALNLEMMFTSSLIQWLYNSRMPMTTKSLYGIAISLLLFSRVAVGQISVIGELSYDRQVKPGEVYEGSLTLRNESDVPQEAKVYQTDYLFHADGTNLYADPGSTPRSNAKWITFSPSDVVLPPHATAPVTYRVSVPRDSLGTLQGSYWSMLMIEGIPSGSPESSLPQDRAKKVMGIIQSIRYGVQIASHVEHSGKKEIRFMDAKLVQGNEGGKVFQLDIENIGNVGMRPDVRVELYNQQGDLKGKYAGIKYRLYPGTSTRQLIELDKDLQGDYKALVIVDDGGDDIFGAQYTLEF